MHIEEDEEDIEEDEEDVEFYGSEDWEVSADTDDEYILEQKNCPKNSQEICRDFRILGAEKLKDSQTRLDRKERWRLYRALDDGRGLHSIRELKTVVGTKEDAIDELDCFRD